MGSQENMENQIGNNENIKNSAAFPEYTKSDDDRSGQSPSGHKLSHLEFGAKSDGSTPQLEKIGLGDLIGANAFESADLKANHIEPGALTGMLSDAMAKIEEKYHSGVYDAAAMPLVKQYLDEMQNMAYIQLERQKLISKRVADIKEANEVAYNAVQDVREDREEVIKQRAEYVQNEVRLKRYKKEQRIKIRRDTKEHLRMLKDIDRLERTATSKSRAKVKAEVSSINDDLKIAEAAMHKIQKESENKTILVNEELKRAESERDAKLAELAGAQAAAEAAEKNLAKTRTEIMENELREKSGYVSEAANHIAREIEKEYDEQVSAIKKEYEELSPQIEESEKEKNKSKEEIKNKIKSIPGLVNKLRPNKEKSKSNQEDSNDDTDKKSNVEESSKDTNKNEKLKNTDNYDASSNKGKSNNEDANKKNTSKNEEAGNKTATSEKQKQNKDDKKSVNNQKVNDNSKNTNSNSAKHKKSNENNNADQHQVSDKKMNNAIKQQNSSDTAEIKDVNKKTKNDDESTK